MPPVTILSPYSGRPVVVREQDLGRAIRDEEGRVFYVVEDSEHGRYAARTRKGSEKDLERYRELQSKVTQLEGDHQAKREQQYAQPHDATGTRRRNPVGMVVLLVLLLAVAAAAYIVVTQPHLVGLGDPPAEGDAQPAPDEGDAEPSAARGLSDPYYRMVAVAASRQPVEPDDWSAVIVPSASGQRPNDSEPTPTPEPTPVVGPKPAAIGEGPARAIVDAEPDPKPVVVPTSTWRPGREPAAYVNDPPDKPFAGFRHTATGLRYKITHPTKGSTAKAGHYVEVRYTAQTLEGEPLIEDGRQTFVLMSGEAIRAFDEGLAGIREGEQVRMLVPRGHSENGSLPGIERVPDRPFLLDVQLVSVKPGVSYVVEQPGNVERDTVMPGDTVLIHYVARVEGRDEVIDATASRSEPMRITLGRDEVIPGLELGLTGMRLGETRLLTIPPYLAYGDREVAGGLIPADAVLSFRVTLVGIDRPEQQ